MKTLWNIVNEMKIKVSFKNTIFIGLLMSLNCILGSGIWLLSGRFFLPSIQWLLCFAGYPCMILGFFGGIIYLYNHVF